MKLMRAYPINQSIYPILLENPPITRWSTINITSNKPERLGVPVRESFRKIENTSIKFSLVYHATIIAKARQRSHEKFVNAR
jgi:hypothetical protein